MFVECRRLGETRTQKLIQTLTGLGVSFNEARGMAYVADRRLEGTPSEQMLLALIDKLINYKGEYYEN